MAIQIFLSCTFSCLNYKINKGLTLTVKFNALIKLDLVPFQPLLMFFVLKFLFCSSKIYFKRIQ
jgi:hypothetical protein